MLSVMPWIKQAIDLEEAAKQRHCRREQELVL
jgi:hypothetical protein